MPLVAILLLLIDGTNAFVAVRTATINNKTNENADISSNFTAANFTTRDALAVTFHRYKKRRAQSSQDF